MVLTNKVDNARGQAMFSGKGNPPIGDMFDDGRGGDLVINIVVGINFVSNLVFNKETWIFNFTNVVI